MSYLKNIDEHFVKFDEAYDRHDYGLVRHYIKEIDYAFFGNITKSVQWIRLPEDLQHAILLRQQQRHERKNLPLN